MNPPLKITTVGELRRELERFPDNWQIVFGCAELEFLHAKERGPKLVQIEFSQPVNARNGKIYVGD